MTTLDTNLISADEAALLLGVKTATIYTYVTRGNLVPVRHPGDRSSWFNREDVAALKRRGVKRRAPKTMFNDPGISSEITLIEDDYFYYRGVDPATLMQDNSFEQVAEFLWTGSIPDERVWKSHPIELHGPHGGDELLPLDRIRLAVVHLAVADHLRFGNEPDAVRQVGRRILRGEINALPVIGSEPASQSLAERLWPRFTAMEPTAPAIKTLNAALIACADHGMSPSTRAARLAASFRVDPHGAIEAGLAVVAGGWHGGRSLSAEAMIRDFVDRGDVESVVGELLRRQGSIPCLGHMRYPVGDPRPKLLVDLLRAATPDHPVIRAFDDLLETVERRHLPSPSHEVGLAAIGNAFEFVDGASEAIFAIGRTAGWLAHAMESYRNPARTAPVAKYVGPRPIV